MDMIVVCCPLVDEPVNRQRYPLAFEALEMARRWNEVPAGVAHYSGSIQVACDKCAALCWLGPEGQKKVRENPLIQRYCVMCVLELAAEGVDVQTRSLSNKAWDA